jgi:hypothetical protein
MMTSLKIKAAVASEGVFAILETSCQLGNNTVSGRGQVATARRRSHALDQFDTTTRCNGPQKLDRKMAFS